jgi:hypothetical protein
MFPRALALLALTLPSLAWGHDLWVERAEGAFVVRYGHRGGEVLPVDGAKVKAVRCVQGGAARDLLGAASFSPTEVRVAATCEVLSVLYDGGYYTLTPDGEVNRPRTEVKQAVKSWASRQLAKWVDPGAPAAAAPTGDELEIVPPPDLARKREGDKVTLRVLSGGKPVNGAVVAIDHRALGETDSRGEVRVRLRGTGLETVDATVRRPLASPEAETLVLEASLTFEVRR